MGGWGSRFLNFLVTFFSDFFSDFLVTFFRKKSLTMGGWGSRFLNIVLFFTPSLKTYLDLYPLNVCEVANVCQYVQFSSHAAALQLLLCRPSAVQLLRGSCTHVFP